MNTHQIDIVKKCVPGMSDRAIRDVFSATLASVNIKGSISLTCVFTSDAFIRRLNRQYRGIDKTTDVLSFPLGDAGAVGRARALGDIFISVPEAKRDAKKEGRIYREELQLLLVHGLLHLLGYDHMQRSDRAKMFPLQNKILKKLGAHAPVFLSID